MTDEVPNELAPQITALPARPRRGAASRPHPGWSGLPLAASLALVGFAVLFGVYGPRVVDRATPPLGIPAWDLGEAASSRHFEQLITATQEPDARVVSISDAEAEIRSILGAAVTVPDLSSLNFVLSPPRLVSVPGAARAALLTYVKSRFGGPESVSLLIVPDRAQYVVFSSFGRPLFLPAREVYPVDLPIDGADASHGLLWSDGAFVRVAVSLTGSTIDDIAEVFLKSTRPDHLGGQNRLGAPNETSADPK